MANYNDFLNELEVYPDASEIDEASNYAQDESKKYILDIDSEVIITVEEGEVYVKWSKCIEDDAEFALNAQVIFDEKFSEKILEIQK